MSKLFLHLLNISITADWIVLVVVLLRFVLKKAPKWMRVVLWGLVALRLLLPVSIESVTSLVPSAETVAVEPMTYEIVQVRDSDPEPVPFTTAEGERIVLHSGFSALNSAVNPVMVQTRVNTVTVLKTVAGWVWLGGAAAMLLYALISYLRLRHRVRASVLLEKGAYVCDEISDPFILGLIVPKIYLPSGMDEQARAYVLAHERAHLKRFDHIWKPLGFLLLAVYWFNPLLWLAYILLCRDIELACDEKVVKELDDTGKAAYSEALVTASVSRRSIAACPLAFGETDVKSRVKSVLNYKKPAFWIILVAILACIAVAVCFLTVPKKDKTVTLSYDGSPTLWFDDWDYGNNPDGPVSVKISSFSDVTFRGTVGGIEAIENGKTRTLFSGMPVLNVYFTDVTGDGKPELIATVSFGSGIIDDHIVVYDYANKQSYVLWNRMQFDFHLYTADGALYVGKTPYMGDKQIDSGTLMMHDGVLSCRWQSDGSYMSLYPELHESELIGEWLVEEERDANDNVIYTRSAELWKEYNFREDGTVTYNETIPVSSDSELAFGHPVAYPYEVHDNYVYIAGDDTSGAFRWGQYDRDMRTLTLMYSTDTGTVYAKLRRMGDGAQNEAALDEATLCMIWMLAEVEAPDGSNGSAYSLGLRQYLEFRSDGTVRMVDTNAFTQRIVPYTLNGNTVQFDGRVLQYEPEDKELFGIDSSTQNTLFYTPTPKVELPALLYDLSLTHDKTDPFVNGLSVEFEDGSPYGCDLVVFIDGFGRCLNVGDADAWKTASLRFVPGDYKATDAIYAHVGYAKLLTVGDREYYIGSMRVFLSDGQLGYHSHIWDFWYPSADASIFVPIEPSMMERNRAVPERACVIKSFDAENRTVTVSYVSFEEPEDGYPAEILYDTVEDETFMFSVTDDTMLVLIDDYTALVKPDRFFRYLEQNRNMYLNGVDAFGDGDDRGIGFWIGLDGDNLLYLCEVYEE